MRESCKHLVKRGMIDWLGMQSRFLQRRITYCALGSLLFLNRSLDTYFV